MWPPTTTAECPHRHSGDQASPDQTPQPYPSCQGCDAPVKELPCGGTRFQAILLGVLSRILGPSISFAKVATPAHTTTRTTSVAHNLLLLSFKLKPRTSKLEIRTAFHCPYFANRLPLGLYFSFHTCVLIVWLEAPPGRHGATTTGRLRAT